MSENDLPTRDRAAEFIMAVHDAAPGITEKVLACGRSADGRSSYQMLTDAAGLREGMTAVDLACGSGALTSLIARRVGSSGRAVGVDCNESELALARTRCRDCGNAVFLHESAGHLSLPDCSVDAVLCHLALMLFNPVDPVLAEIARILRPRGILAAVVPGLNGTSAAFAAIRRELGAVVAEDVAPDRLIALGNAEFSDAGAIRNLSAKTGKFEPEIGFSDFEVIFRETPEALAALLMPFFYYTYLLSDDGKKELLKVWAATFRRTMPAGAAVAEFRLPLSVVSLRK